MKTLAKVLIASNMLFTLVLTPQLLTTDNSQTLVPKIIQYGAEWGT